MTKLKPCPCCGPKAFIVPSAKRYELGGVYPWRAELRCYECGLTISRIAATEKEALNEAIKAWNTRAEREIGISKFQSITGTSYIKAKSILSALERAGVKVEYPA